MSSTSAPSKPVDANTSVSVWNIDPAHSIAEFRVRHMMISYVRGKFSGLSGVLNLNESDYTRSTVAVSIRAASIRTVDERLDAHLKNADFFDVEKFPELTFASKSIQVAGSRNYLVNGDLTIHGVTRPVVLTVNDVSDRPTILGATTDWSFRVRQDQS
jgi:polyisoprenoid-binding protein YceI